MIDGKIKKIVKEFFASMLQKTFRYTWMEVSEAAERFIVKISGDKFFIPNTYAKTLLDKEIVELCDDGFHYKRYINGVLKTKVMVGNPKDIKKL